MKQIILLALILTSLSYATWEYSDATARTCFNLTSNDTLHGSDNYGWYEIADITIPIGNLSLDSNLRLYSVTEDSDLSLFNLYNNSTHVTFLIPVADSTNNTQYCIYEGSASMERLQDVTPYNFAFDDSLTGFDYDTGWAFTNGIITTNNDPSGVLQYTDLYSNEIQLYAKIWMKIKYESGSSPSWAGTGLYDCFPYCTLDTGFVGLRGNQSVYNLDDSPVNFYNGTGWLIYKIIYDKPNSKYNITIYDENLSELSSGLYSYDQNDNDISSKVLFRNNGLNVSLDYVTYSLGSTNGDNTGVYDVQSIEETLLNSNISILSPLFGANYVYDDGLTYRVYVATDFDNCSFYNNDNLLDTDTSISAGDIISGTVDNYVSGDNTFKVGCNNNESIRFAEYTVSGSDPYELFNNAFDIDIDSLCDSDVLVNLENCSEYYDLNTYYDYGAVVCYSLPADDYSCITDEDIDNKTKNSYTIFYTDSFDWIGAETATATINHTGAQFYYQSQPINGKIEIFDDYKFVYIPANDRPTDSDVRSPDLIPSYWAGFTNNDRMILVSDIDNNWYIAGGNGFIDYDENYSKIVIATNVLLVSPEADSIFSEGIFKRQTCQIINSTFDIAMQSTAQKTYTVTVVGDTPYSYTQTGGTLIDAINTDNVSTISIAVDGNAVCYYSADQTRLFLPFDFSDFGGALGGFLILIMIIFTTILSIVAPYAIIIPFMLNDLYSVFNLSQMLLLGLFSVVGGLVMNSFAIERGIKHLVIIVAVALSFMGALQPYDDAIGVDLGIYSSILNSFEEITTANTFFEFVSGSFNFIVQLALLIITLPVQLAKLIFALLQFLSEPLYTAARPFENILVVGTSMYIYIKFFEIITNRFRGI